jgi:hypothetical protein
MGMKRKEGWSRCCESTPTRIGIGNGNQGWALEKDVPQCTNTHHGRRYTFTQSWMRQCKCNQKIMNILCFTHWNRYFPSQRDYAIDAFCFVSLKPSLIPMWPLPCPFAPSACPAAPSGLQIPAHRLQSCPQRPLHTPPPGQPTSTTSRR